MSKPRQKQAPTPPVSAPRPLYRSGAVARMVHMPVSTLRIWERRYQAVSPSTSPSGHRLYAAADVERVAVLRQLTENGHAIGSIADLSMEQLHEVARSHLTTVARQGPERAPAATPGRQTVSRCVVVGVALARRLQRPALRRCMAGSVQVLATFDTLAEAVRASRDTACDRLIWQSPGLRADAVPELLAAQAACGAASVTVLYAFAGAPARQAFAGAGVQLLREPQDDAALGSWLSSQGGSSAGGATPTRPSAAAADALWLAAGDIAPRRFDDATLADFAGLTSSMSCECPRHVAELLMQLASFERYSADCESVGAADAELHAHLHRVAATARTLFESALERVAIHENLPLRRGDPMP